MRRCCAYFVVLAVAALAFGASAATTAPSNPALTAHADSTRGADCVLHLLVPTIDHRSHEIKGPAWPRCRRKPANIVLHVEVIRYASETDSVGKVVSDELVVENPPTLAKYAHSAVADCEPGRYATLAWLDVFQPPVLKAYPSLTRGWLYITNKKQCE